MARVTYESKDNAGHKFWVARYGRYAIRIDATRRGVYPWLITLEGRSVRKGVAPDRDEAADAVSDASTSCPARSRSCDPGGLLPGSTPPVRSVIRALLSVVAIVCRRSPTSDGLATAWREAWQPTHGNFCVIRQSGKRRAARQAGRGPSSRPDGPDQPGPDDPTAMGTTRLARREAAEGAIGGYRVHPVVADRDAVPAAKVNKEAWSDGDQPASPTAAWLASP
jgi:hypothetical protein